MPFPKGSPMHGPGMVAGIRAGGFLFLTAIRGRDPETGKTSDDTREQAVQAFKNLTAVLAASGARLEDVVKVTLYLHDLQYRMAFHEVWMKVYPKVPPARIAVQVADANPVPGGNSHFALDVIAVAPARRVRLLKSKVTRRKQTAAVRTAKQRRRRS